MKSIFVVGNRDGEVFNKKLTDECYLRTWAFANKNDAEKCCFKDNIVVEFIPKKK